MQPTVPTVTVPELTGEVYLLDVREPAEWAAGHAPGAQHLPMHELPGRLAEVPTDREVVVVCRVGNRSGQVVQFLVEQGWQNVRNLAGGMLDWVAAGRPLVSDSGGPAMVR